MVVAEKYSASLFSLVLSLQAIQQQPQLSYCSNTITSTFQQLSNHLNRPLTVTERKESETRVLWCWSPPGYFSPAVAFSTSGVLAARSLTLPVLPHLSQYLRDVVVGYGACCCLYERVLLAAARSPATKVAASENSFLVAFVAA